DLRADRRRSGEHDGNFVHLRIQGAVPGARVRLRVGDRSRGVRLRRDHHGGVRAPAAGGATVRKSGSDPKFRVGTYLGVVLVAAYCLAPLAWQLVTSLKPPAELSSLPPLLPSRITFEHYAAVFTGHPFPRMLLNSF